MTHTYSFRYNELSVNLSEVSKVLGYEGQELPEPFPTYIQQVMDECQKLTDISGSYHLVNDGSIDFASQSINANGVGFKVGKTICNELTNSSKLAFFICTAGKKISQKSENLLHGDDPVLGYVYDVFGSVITEAVADKIQQLVKESASKEGNKTTNRYSPGYCHWEVADQPKLFSLFNGSTSGVSLTDSHLMHPVKSVSGVIGIGEHVKYREYECTLCNLQTCIYRNTGGH